MTRKGSAGLVLAAALFLATPSVGADRTRATLVRTSATVLARTPHNNRLELRAIVAAIKPGDVLLMTIVSFDGCGDATPARADERTVVFDRAAAQRSVRQEIPVQRAARYEITFQLTATGEEFDEIENTSAFTTIEERNCS